MNARPEPVQRTAEAAAATPHGRDRTAQQAGGGADTRLERLTTLLEVEGALRKLPDRRAVEIFAVNELRRLLPYSQAAFISFDSHGRARISAFSGISQVDRQAPLVLALQEAAERLLQRSTERDSLRGNLKEAVDETAGKALADWPFEYYLWHVLRERDGRPFGALLFMRGEAWRDSDEVIGTRLAEAVGVAIKALAPRSVLERMRVPRRVLGALALVVLALLLVPVPMTAIAPVEVVADDPFPVTAPMDGVIAQVLVNPNTPVRKGQVLFRFDDTTLKADAEVAARQEAVVLARLATLRKAAFADPQARQQLAEAETELELARVQRERAEQLLARVEAKAPEAGIVIFADKTRLIGKPVRTGERVMEIADPARVVFRIDLPVSDAIVIGKGAKVRVFLDADPLHAIAARVRWASFHAEEVPGGLLAFRIIAEPVAEDEAARQALQERLRIGFRGSAQVHGETVPLGFYLFRRPIAAVRQFLGW